VDPELASGALRIERVNPMELYPDEFLGLVRRSVEDDGVEMIMIDSLRGYLLAMAEFGKPVAHVHNLVSYLSRHGVTTLLTNEAESIAGPTVTASELGVSHLADNLLLLRYAESRGGLIRVIGA
jgi:circadian clock protein KaiC